MNEALKHKQGIRAKFSDPGSANNFRMRLHKARQLDRDANREIYPEGHKLHGRSIYDQIFTTIRQDGKGKFLLNLERRTIEAMDIEPIGDTDDDQTLNSDRGTSSRESESQRTESQSPVESATPEVESLFEPAEISQEGTDPKKINRRV